MVAEATNLAKSRRCIRLRGEFPLCPPNSTLRLPIHFSILGQSQLNSGGVSTVWEGAGFLISSPKAGWLWEDLDDDLNALLSPFTPPLLPHSPHPYTLMSFLSFSPPVCPLCLPGTLALFTPR